MIGFANLVFFPNPDNGWWRALVVHGDAEYRCIQTGPERYSVAVCRHDLSKTQVDELLQESTKDV